MRIRLDKISDEPFLWEETETVPAEALERSELVALSPVRWSGRVSRTDPGWVFRARLEYEQTLVCDRCLGEMRDPVTAEIDLLVLVEPETAAGEEEVELSESDLGVLTVHEEELDTDPLLYEQLQLGIPMKPLCKPDCRGLCPTCGADRNLEPCECSERSTDPRWAALEALTVPDRDDESKR